MSLNAIKVGFMTEAWGGRGEYQAPPPKGDTKSQYQDRIIKGPDGVTVKLKLYRNVEFDVWEVRYLVSKGSPRFVRDEGKSYEAMDKNDAIGTMDQMFKELYTKFPEGAYELNWGRDKTMVTVVKRNV